MRASRIYSPESLSLGGVLAAGYGRGSGDSLQSGFVGSEPCGFVIQVLPLGELRTAHLPDPLALDDVEVCTSRAEARCASRCRAMTKSRF